MDILHTSVHLSYLTGTANDTGTLLTDAATTDGTDYIANDTITWLSSCSSILLFLSRTATDVDYLSDAA